LLFTGQKNITILKTSDAIVRVLEDAITGSYSIGLRTDKDFEWKYISKELHDLLVAELSEQEGKRL
jgi:hypothetical protein